MCESKLILRIIYLCLLINFASSYIYASNNRDSLNQSSIKEGECSWIGLRIGAQTKPHNVASTYKIQNWWTIFISYEYQFDKTFSLLTEFQLFKRRKDDAYSVSTEISVLRIGFKAQTNIQKKIYPAVEAGIGLGKITLSGLDIYYGGCINFKISEAMAIVFDARTSIIPDYGFWITLGFIHRI